MNIAVYLDLPNGGAKKTMDEVLTLLGKDHNLKIFSPKNSKSLLSGRLASDMYCLTGSRFNQKKIAKDIDNGGFDVCFVTHDRYLQSPWILRYLKTPTVFLCQEPTRAFFEQFLDIDKKLPILNRCYEVANRYFRKGAEIHNAQFASKIIANSHYSVESIFRSYGRYSTPVYLGVNFADFYPKNQKKLNQVLIVGNNEPQKCLSLAVESISKIKKATRPSLVIACPRKNNLEPIVKMARHKKVNLRVLTGLNSNQLAHQYRCSLLTLATAHLEPFGLSVVESFACGTPVVAVNEAGFRETVQNWKSGYLCKRDPQKIADKVSLLISNSLLRKKMGQKAASIAQKRFSWLKTVSSIEKVLYELT